MNDRTWESFALGDHYITDAITVTETHVVSWAGLTGDWVPLHVDAEYASRSAFGQRIAHGPLTLGLALGLGTRTGIFGDSVMAWLGLDEVRLPRPVYFGDTISTRIEVLESKPSSKPGRGLTILGYCVTNQRDEVVMTFRSSFFLAMSGNGAET